MEKPTPALIVLLPPGLEPVLIRGGGGAQMIVAIQGQPVRGQGQLPRVDQAELPGEPVMGGGQPGWPKLWSRSDFTWCGGSLSTSWLRCAPRRPGISRAEDAPSGASVEWAGVARAALAQSLPKARPDPQLITSGAAPPSSRRPMSRHGRWPYGVTEAVRRNR